MGEWRNAASAVDAFAAGAADETLSSESEGVFAPDVRSRDCGSTSRMNEDGRLLGREVASVEARGGPSESRIPAGRFSAAASSSSSAAAAPGKGEGEGDGVIDLLDSPIAPAPALPWLLPCARSSSRETTTSPALDASVKDLLSTSGYGLALSRMPKLGWANAGVVLPVPGERAGE